VVKAVLFDLDRTLWRSTHTPDWEAVTRAQASLLAPAFDKAGADTDVAAFVRRFWAEFAAADSAPNPSLRELHGPSLMATTLEALGLAPSPDLSEALWDAMCCLPFHHYNIAIYPDALSTVERLCRDGIRLAVVTSRPQTAPVLARELKALGLPDVWETIVTSGDLGFRKPHPILLETALRRLDLASNEAVVVGDSYENDVLPGMKLGIPAVHKLNDSDPTDWTVDAIGKAVPKPSGSYQIRDLTDLFILDLFRR
jgi:FMN phosphatase YigB (HAD superfamily)